MLRQAGNLGAVGMEIAISIAIGFFGGRFVDRHFQTAPWFMWFGFAAGIGAGIKALVRVVRSYQRAFPSEPPKDSDEGHVDP